MIELRFGRPALAIVAVGLAVAAADREKLLRADDARLLDACSGPVGDAALPGRMFAPQALIAMKGGDAVAGLRGRPRGRGP